MNATDPSLDLHRAALGPSLRSIETTLGSNVVGVYLEGSFAWGDPVATSDLDLRVVVSDSPSDSQRRALREIAAALQEETKREIGLRIELLGDLKRVGAVRFQRTHMLAGRDVRSDIPVKPIDAFAHDSLVNAHDLIVSLRVRLGRRISFPIGYPQPAEEFRGYDDQPVLDAGTWIPSSKRLVTIVLAIATAFVADRGNYVFSKGDVPSRYADIVGGDWATFVSAVHDQCRIKAAYRLPTSAEERRSLGELCIRALDYENLLLGKSLALFRSDLTGTEAARQQAARRRLEAFRL